jgi:peptide chain release factor 1
MGKNDILEKKILEFLRYLGKIEEEKKHPKLILSKKENYQNFTTNKEESKISLLLLKSKKEYEKIENELLECQALKKEEISKENQVLLEQEIDKLEKDKYDLAVEIKKELFKEEGIEQNVLVEIRPGTGGIEAGLFARDLYRMYHKFADKKKWKVELIETNVDGVGNFNFVSLLVKGLDVFNYLKFESGVHRVQRVPVTESKGRIHTSTATVAVLPEAQDLNIKIKSQDLKIETYRSSGAGGQHVNTTDSAVRITHIPTGVVATSQNGRSQHDNKEKALFVLKSRVSEKYLQEQEKEIGNLRSSAIGTAERAEKIRTYNYPQNRVTDHRVNVS